MKLTGNKCLCRACGEVFSTDSNFQKHRKGKYGIDRRCVDPETVGLLKSEAGVWKGQPRVMPA